MFQIHTVCYTRKYDSKFKEEKHLQTEQSDASNDWYNTTIITTETTTTTTTTTTVKLLINADEQLFRVLSKYFLGKDVSASL